MYAQPVSELSRQLLALRTHRTARRGRDTGRPPAPRISEPVYLDQRPAEAEGRAVPGHFEGDLVIGAGRTAVATLVEPASRYLTGVPLTGRDSRTGCDAAALDPLPPQLKRSLTWDCGSELARHATGDRDRAPGLPRPAALPWQRGSNTNANRILQGYLPTGTTISSDPAYLATLAAETSDRPRKILGWKILCTCQAADAGVDRLRAPLEERASMLLLMG